MSEVPQENPETQKDKINISEVKIPEVVLNNPGLACAAMGLCLTELQTFILDPAKPIADKLVAEVYKNPKEEPWDKAATAEQLIWAAINFYTAGQRAKYDIHRPKSAAQRGDIITLPEDLYVQALRDQPEDKFIVTPDINPVKASCISAFKRDPHTIMSSFVGLHYAVDNYLWEQMRIQYQASYDLLDLLETNRREFFMEPIREQLERGAIIASIGLPFPGWQEARNTMSDDLEFRKVVDKQGNISRGIITRRFTSPQAQELALTAIKLVHRLNNERPAVFTQTAKQNLQEFTPNLRSVKTSIAQLSPYEKSLLPFFGREELLARTKPDDPDTDPSLEWSQSLKDFVKTLNLDDQQGSK